MPPKKSTTAAPKKAAAAAPAHGSYQDMIKEAILNLKERNGSSRQAIKKYIQANNNLGATTDAQFSNHISKALQVGEDAGVFSRPKGPSGPVKLAKKDAKPAASKASPPAKPAAKKEKEAPAKAAPAKKSTSTKAAPKKAAPAKKATASKAAPKKKADTAKPKANAGRPRKTAAPAPAVEDKPAVVLGKTKSGRVTKSRQPAAVAKPTRKAAATKKTSAKKATPKKATPKKASA